MSQICLSIANHSLWNHSAIFGETKNGSITIVPKQVVHPNQKSHQKHIHHRQNYHLFSIFLCGSVAFVTKSAGRETIMEKSKTQLLCLGRLERGTKNAELDPEAGDRDSLIPS